MTGEIHEEHPFETPEAQRDPVRQFRGRLAAPVTIVTAGAADSRSGLTVSSLMVAEGEPGSVCFLLGSEADLHDAVQRTKRFIVHILTQDERQLSDVFAGIRPSPGGVFSGVDVEATQWGPAIPTATNRIYCSLTEIVEIGYSNLVTAVIDRVEVDDLTDPLVYFRGAYRHLR